MDNTYLEMYKIRSSYDSDKSMQNMDIVIKIQSIELNIAPFYGEVPQGQRLQVLIETVHIQSKFRQMEVLRARKKLLLGNKEGINVFVGKVEIN